MKLYELYSIQKSLEFACLFYLVQEEAESVRSDM